MVSLATTEDVEARLGRSLTTEENGRIGALLADASANVRRVSTQQFTAGTSTITVTRSRNGRVRLPQRPVVSVQTVTDINANALSYVRVNNELRISGTPLNAWELEPYRSPVSEVIVAYTHGGDVPDQIIGVVCSIVARALGQKPDEAGVVQESIDGYSYSTGSAAAQGGLGMMASEREICESFRRPSSPIAILT